MVRARIETRSLLRTDPNDQKHARKVNYRFTSWQNDLLSIPFAVASAQTPKRVCAVYYLVIGLALQLIVIGLALQL